MLNDKSIISIVTPSLGQGVYIEDTIQSVLSQSGDFYIDYIIIDGGSADGSVEIIREYESLLKDNCPIRRAHGLLFYTPPVQGFEYNRCRGISYRWISERDTGHGNALNKGFVMSVGNIMGWLNSDDKYHAGAFRSVAEIFEMFEDVHWITGRQTVWNKGGTLSNSSERYKNIYDFLLGDYKWIQQESTFWTRRLWLLSGARIHEGYNLMVDGELWCRFFLHEELWHVDCLLGGYRMHHKNRAEIFRKQVLEEMDRAVLELQKQVPRSVMNLAEKMGEGYPYSDVTDRIRYNIIVKKNDSWVKTYVNYYVHQYFNKNKDFISIKKSYSYRVGNFLLRPFIKLKKYLEKCF